MNINDLSIGELKAAYDFVVMGLKNMEDDAKRKGAPVHSIPAHKEILSAADSVIMT